MSAYSRLQDRYGNILAAPPPPGPSICEVCRRGTGGYPLCFRCNRHRAVLGAEAADVVAPISMAVSGMQLARELGGYKYNRVAAVRNDYATGLASVLAAFLRRHETCLAHAAGAEVFDVVTVVPGSKLKAGAHPLAAMLERRIGQTRPRFEHLLTTDGPNDRELRPDRFAVSGDLRDRAVLLVDDTWTTGASLQSAAAALKRAGAGKVAGTVIGRRLDSGDPSARPVLKAIASQPFDWDACVLCRTD